MNLIITPHHLDSLKDLSAFADGFLLGHDSVATRLTRSFSFDEIDQAISFAEKHHKKIYLHANRFFHPGQEPNIKTFLAFCQNKAISGIVFSDVTLFEFAKDYELQDRMIYNPDTLMTNYDDIAFWQAHVSAVFLAKEITLSEIEAIASKTNHKLFMYGFGRLPIFTSRRQLLSAYFDQIQLDSDPLGKIYRLVEEMRGDDAYTIFENEAGTNIYSPYAFSIHDVLPTLATKIDSVFIDTILYDDTLGLAVLKLYNQIQNNLDIVPSVEDIQAHTQTLWDQGFLYKKTVYKKESYEKN